MWFDVWLLARGIGLGDIFEDISTSVRLFSQFICLTLCLYIPLFLKEIQKFVETLQRSLEGIVLVVQMHKIYFTSVTLPERCCEVFFANFCVLQLFLCASFILRTIQFLYISFFYGWSWRYSEGYLIKETICQHLSLFLVQTIFCIYLTVKVVRKIEEHIHVFSDMSSMRTGLQHTYCIVTTCQLVNLLWEPCFNPVLVQD